MSRTAPVEKSKHKQAPTSWQLCKTLFQLRYKPALTFYDLMYKAGSQLDDYPFWQTNRFNVVLKNPSKRCSVTIDHAAATYEQDSSEVETEVQRVHELVEKLTDALKITSFERLGFRRQYLIPQEMTFESLVLLLDAKLFSNDERLRRFMPASVRDLNYRLDSKEDEYLYHFTIGPVRKNEIPNWIQFNRQNHLDPEQPDEDLRRIVDKYPAVSVLIDIDIYKMGKDLPLKEVEPFLEFARRQTDQLTLKLRNYLFSTEIES